MRLCFIWYLFLFFVSFFFFYIFFGHAVDIITNCFGSRVLKPYQGEGGCLGEGGEGGPGGRICTLELGRSVPPPQNNTDLSNY